MALIKGFKKQEGARKTLAVMLAILISITGIPLYPHAVQAQADIPDVAQAESLAVGEDMLVDANAPNGLSDGALTKADTLQSPGGSGAESLLPPQADTIPEVTTPSEADAPTKEEIPAPETPRDITQNEEILTFTLEGIEYTQADGKAERLVAAENRLDASAVEAKVLSQFNLQYKVVGQQASMKKGDSFTLTLPTKSFMLPTLEALREANVALETSLLYSLVQDGVVVTFNEEVSETRNPLEFTLSVPVVLAEGVLSKESTSVEVALQKENICTISLPALKDKEEAALGTPLVGAPLGIAPLVDAGTTTARLEKEWRDNDDANRPVQKLIDDGLLAVWFTIGGESEAKLDDSTKDKLKLDTVPAITFNSSGTGTSGTIYECAGLPSSVDNKNVGYVIKEDEEAIENLGYVQQIKDGKLYNIKTTSFKSTVEVRDGAKGWRPSLTSYVLYDAKYPMTKIEGATVTWVWDSTNKWSSEVSGLPQYRLDGSQIEYCLIAEEPNMDADYYDPEYNNKAVPNYGTNVTECHNGGTIIFTLKGNTAYTATKDWLDQGDSTNRPNATLYLWRYIQKDENGFMQASQVRDAGNNLIEMVIPTTASKNSFDLIVESLPKYDPEGYPYVYLTRETLGGNNSGGYEQVFGKISGSDGSVEDTLPGANVSRDAADKSIYNGGTISNRRTEAITVTKQKTWKASVYQSQIEDVVVTLLLQSRPTGSKDDVAWTDTTTSQKLTGFKAEIMTMSVSSSAPKYDQLGRELEYRWVEKSITQGDDPTELLLPDGTFLLACNKAANEADPKDPEHFVSKDELIDPKDPTKGTWIVNRLVGELDYTIDKTWQQANDSDGKPVYGKTAPEGASLTVEILQNGKKMNPERLYVMDGTVDEKNKETEPWHVYVDDLPKYDEDGVPYTYIAEEVEGVNGWHPAYSYDIAKRTTNIKNNSGGSGTAIKVEKKWIDDFDVDHRYPAVVKLTKKNDSAWSSEEVALTAGNNWWAWVSVEEGTTYKDYVLTEIRLDVPPGVQGQGQVEGGRVATNYHEYKVTESVDDDRGVLQVTNKRIGVIDVTLTKKWVDWDSQKRPGATLKLVCIEHPESVDYINNTVKASSSDVLPIQQTVAGKVVPAAAIQQVAGTGDLTYPSKNDLSTYQFHNLPKYDAEGKVIHYTVVEEEVSPDSGSFAELDYSPSVNQIRYKVGDAHTDDQQEMEATNTRTGTKNVEFHKEWRDAYAQEHGKRPDIYLTLWQNDPTNSESFIKVDTTGFKDYSWKARTDKVGSPIDALNQWTATFENLPKYDKSGKEITYYAQESMSANGTEFDYQEVTFDGATKDVKDPVDVIIATILEENGTFINGIENNVIIEGKKFWKSIPTGYPSAQLPKIEIHLDQVLAGKSPSGDIRVENISVTEDLTNVEGTNDFTFSISEDAKDQKLPKYNDAGQLYTYQVREIFPATPKPGLDKFEDIYTGSVSGFVLENVYNTTGEKNTGNLVVKKKWDNHPTGKPYPKADFTLYRQYSIASQEPGTTTLSEKEKVTTSTLNHADSKEGKTSVVFEGLPVYAPDGQPYLYSVEEALVLGYTTKVSVGSKGAPGVVFSDVSLSEPSLVNVEEKGIVGAATTQVDFRNTYNEGEISLTGTKVWDDYSDAFGLRPKGIDLKLYRWADAQSEQGNGITEKEIVLIPATLTWDKKGNSWRYKVEPLERYAPNGTAWKYEIVEKPTEAAASYGATKKTAMVSSVDGDGNVFMENIENTLSTKASVKKVWDDGGNSHNLRPLTVNAKLQMKPEGGVWADASVEFERILTIPTSFEIKLSSDNKWEYSFEKLPSGKRETEEGSVVPYSYRFAETEIGDNDKIKIEEDGTYAFTDGKPHAYLPTGKISEEKTTITNTMTKEGSTSLTVSKTWEDSMGVFATRPPAQKWKIPFTLQRSINFLDITPTWTDVYEAGSTTDLVTGYVEGAKNEHTKSATIDNLPKYDAEGKEFRYRAVEKQATGYKEPAYQYPAQNVTSITNTLETTPVSGTKIWVDRDNVGKDRPASVELELYRQAKDTSIDIEKVTAIDPPIWTETNSGVWKYAYMDVLPKYNRSGNEYSYTVKEASVPGGYWVSYGNSTNPETGGDPLNVTNTQTSFSLNKVDAASSAPIKSDELELSVYAAEDTAATKALAIWKRSANATVSLKVSGDSMRVGANKEIIGLPVGKYVLKETGTPSIYVTADNIPFEIAEKGTLLSSVSGVVSGDLANGITLTMANKSFTTSVSLTKVDGTSGDSLAGAEFSLFKGDKALGDPVASNSEGKVSFTLEEKGTYTIKETKAATGYTLGANPYEATFSVENTKDFDDQTLSLSELGVAENATKYKLTVSNATYKDGSVANTRLAGTVNLTKRDVDNEDAPLNGAVFALYEGTVDVGTSKELGKFTTGVTYVSPTGATGTNSAVGILSIAGLAWGDYSLLEVSAEGYVISDTTYPFTIEATTQDEATKTPMLVNLGTIENTQTELAFTKLELFAESCSDASLGVLASDATRPLEGAEFTAFSDEACSIKAAVAISDVDGRVVFRKLAAGTYWLKETLVPVGRAPHDALYKAVFSPDGELQSFGTSDKPEGVLTEVINEVLRADIVIQKVSETDPSKTLPGSTYGLYKPTPTQESPLLRAIGKMRFAVQPVAAVPSSLAGDMQLIARATTDSSGVLKFEGVLMDTSYVIRELVAPDGSLLSEKPIQIEFAMSGDGNIKISKFDDGSGTAFVDENGVIVWREPQVMVSFSKNDTEGRLLAGARLQVVDEAGAVVVEPWMSSAEKSHLVEGVLVAGKSYSLVELSAPSGYKLADPVKFVVEDPVLGPDQNFTQNVVMVNHKVPVVPKKSALVKASGLAKTGDTGLLSLLGGMVSLGVGSVVVARMRLRRRYAGRS